MTHGGWREPARKRTGSGLLGIFVVVAVALGVTVVFGPSRAVAAPASLAAEPVSGPCLSEAKGRDAATAMAVRCGTTVEVLDQRSETAQVWAKPDGTLKAELHNGPERFRDGDAWRDVDLTLKLRPDGSVAPKAHPRGLELAGSGNGGEVDLVSVRTGAEQTARRMAMTWTGVLPVPVLKENTATYADVLPGIDVVVTVSPLGFEQFLVVKSASAVSRIPDARLGMKIGGLNPVTEATGGISFKDGSGRALAVMPTASMWDATVDSTTGMPAHTRKVDVDLAAPTTAGTAHGLRLGTDQAWLTDPARRFPITIDPGLVADNDTHVRKNDRYSSFFGSSELLVGSSDGGNNTARSFLRWYYDPIYGAKIFDAKLKLVNHHSYSCRQTEWQLWSAGYIDPGTTWDNMPAPLNYYHSSTQTEGHPDCEGDNKVEIAATNFLQDIANAQYPYITMLLMAADENDVYGWKRFNSADAGSGRPSLEINYTMPPTTSNVKVAASCVTSCTSPTTVRVLTPQLQATVSDPEGTALTAEFQLWNAAQTTMVASQSFGGVASGSTVTWTTGQLANNTQYHFRVRSKDTPGAESAWSGWSTFTTNTAGPSTPSNVAAAGDCHNSCASPAMLRNLRPTFSASVAHPFGDSMTVSFEVWNSSQTTLVASGTKNSVPPNTATTWQPGSNLPQNQQLRLRVTSSDTYGRFSNWSPWYLFTTDVTPPVLPAVSSTLYLDKNTGTYNGGVGVPGVFALTPGTSTDVVQYQWKLNNGAVTPINVTAGASANLIITPTTSLEQLLQVQTLDAAGWTSGWKDYPFLVRAQAVDVAYWKLDSNTTSVTGGSAYTGTLNGGPTYVDSAINGGSGSGKGLSLDGVDDYMSGQTAISTAHAAGFSVAAWAKPTALTGYHTVVAQQGHNGYAFRIYYKPETNRWCFNLRATDDAASPIYGACSDTITPAVGVWTHLTGVYDPVAGKIRLYVNGGPSNGYVAGSVNETSAPITMWQSTGDWRIGRSDSGGYFTGVIDEARAYQRALPEVEARQLFIDCWANSCPQLPVAADPVKDCLNTTSPMCVGEWKFDEGTGATATDWSEQENSLTFNGSAAWTAAGYNSSSGISFDGSANGYVSTAGPVLLTDQSYTVSAWARLTNKDGWRSVLVQDGTYHAAFRLDYEISEDKWCFLVRKDATATSLYERACGPQPKLDVWTHLAGVYDRSANQIRLYVNGQLAATATHNTPWRSTGPLTVGRGKFTDANGTRFNDWFVGQIDLVRAYQGAMSGAQVAQLFVEQLAPPKLVTWWELDDFGSPTVDDLSPQNNDGTLSATGATWTEDGHDGTAVTFDGVSGSIQTGGPVLVTTDSFSVSAWARVEQTPSGTWNVIGQDGNVISGFYLGVRQNSTTLAYHWTFLMHASDGAGPTVRVQSLSPIAAGDVGTWVHVTGVYDAIRSEIRLYVNGVLQGTASRTATPWQATGPLSIGRAKFNSGPVDFFPGSIDSVRAYQGALSDAQALKVYQGLDI